MLNNRYIELINKKIDGIINGKEKMELDKLLSVNDEARKYYDALNDTAKLLNNDINNPPEPSANLKKTILNKIDPNLYSESPDRNIKIDFFTKFKSKLEPKLAITFASGLVAGLVLFMLIFYNVKIQTGSRIDYSGTMGLVDQNNAVKISTWDVNTSGISGDVSLYKLNNYYWLNIELASNEKYDFRFHFPQADIYFDNITPLSSSDFEFKQGKDYVKIAGISSAHYYLFFNKLSKQSSNVTYDIFVKGAIVFSKELKIK